MRVRPYFIYAPEASISLPIYPRWCNIIILSARSTRKSEEVMDRVKFRSEIEDKYKWDLSAIYADDEAWEADFSSLVRQVPKLDRFAGKLNSADKILECLRLSDKMGMTYGELYVYARQRRDEDASAEKYCAMCDRADALGVKISEHSAFISPELTALDKEFLQGLIERAEFADYDYQLSEIIRRKEHTLSGAEEKLLAGVTLFSDGFHDAFNMFDSLDVKFRQVRADDGHMIEMSHGIYSKLLSSGSRQERKQAFESMFDAYGDMLHTLGQLYAGNVKKDWFFARARKYPDCLTRAMSGENVPREIYDNLIKSVHAGLRHLHAYMAWRAEKMGLKKLHMYDLHVPPQTDYDLSVSYEEACELVKKALSPLGEEYLSHIREAMENRWIDVYENKGKRTGAYSWGTYLSHPYVLLNYNGTAHDVFTIAHELGHSMHSYYSDRAQPYAKSQYEIFVAEVASTVNEVLLLKYMLKNSSSSQEREYLLTYYLDMFRTTLFRQTQFAEFEQKAHELAEKDLPVTCDKLSQIYLKLNKLYYGKSVISDKRIAWEWARIPHFYRSFYVYKYSTGLTSAVSIARGILAGDKVVTEGYKKFLSAGGSMPPAEILKLAGVDLTTSKPFDDAMKEMEDTLKMLIDGAENLR